MLYLKITDKNKTVKFEAQGSVIQEIYHGDLKEGDEICIRLDGTNTLAVQLDRTLKESYLYCPNKSFTFTVPSKRELEAGYAPNAFQGETHPIFAREVEDDEFISFGISR